MQPAGVAFGIALMLPDRHACLHLVDDVAARRKRGIAVRRAHADPDGQFADGQVAHAVHAARVEHREPLNRLGQHYDIDPDDPAKWGTLMKGHWFWDFAFLNSNYHLEHHYFPGVPFYRLPELQRALTPFYARKQMRWQSYGGLLYGWFIQNRAPHTNWQDPPGMANGKWQMGNGIAKGLMGDRQR